MGVSMETSSGWQSKENNPLPWRLLEQHRDRSHRDSALSGAHGDRLNIKCGNFCCSLKKKPWEETRKWSVCLTSKEKRQITPVPSHGQNAYAVCRRAFVLPACRCGSSPVAGVSY